MKKHQKVELKKNQTQSVSHFTTKMTSPNISSGNMSPSLDFFSQSGAKSNEITNPKLFMLLLNEKLKALGKLMHKFTSNGMVLQELVAKSNPEYNNILADFRTDTEEIEKTIEDIVTPRFRHKGLEASRRSSLDGYPSTLKEPIRDKSIERMKDKIISDLKHENDIKDSQIKQLHSLLINLKRTAKNLTRENDKLKEEAEGNKIITDSQEGKISGLLDLYVEKTKKNNEKSLAKENKAIFRPKELKICRCESSEVVSDCKFDKLVKEMRNQLKTKEKETSDKIHEFEEFRVKTQKNLQKAQREIDRLNSESTIKNNKILIQENYNLNKKLSEVITEKKNLQEVNMEIIQKNDNLQKEIQRINQELQKTRGDFGKLGKKLIDYENRRKVIMKSNHIYMAYDNIEVFPDTQKLNDIILKERQTLETRMGENISLYQNKIKNLEAEIVKLKSNHGELMTAQGHAVKEMVKSSANIENLNTKIQILYEKLKKSDEQNAKLIYENQNLSKKLAEKVENQGNLEKQIIKSARELEKEKCNHRSMVKLFKTIKEFEGKCYDFQISIEKKMGIISDSLEEKTDKFKGVKGKLKCLSTFYKSQISEVKKTILCLNHAMNDKDVNMCKLLTAIEELEESLERKNALTFDLEAEKNTLLATRDKLIIQCNKQSEEIIFLKTKQYKDEDLSVKTENLDLKNAKNIKIEDVLFEDKMSEQSTSEDANQVIKDYKLQISFLQGKCTNLEIKEKELQGKLLIARHLENSKAQLANANAQKEIAKKEAAYIDQEKNIDITEYIPMKIVSFENKPWYLIKHKLNGKLLWTDNEIVTNLKDEYEELSQKYNSSTISSMKLSEELLICRKLLTLIENISKELNLQEILKILPKEKTYNKQLSRASPFRYQKDDLSESLLENLKSTKDYVVDNQFKTFSDMSSRGIEKGLHAFSKSGCIGSQDSEEELIKLTEKLEKVNKVLSFKEELIRHYEDKIFKLKGKQNEDMEKITKAKSVIEKYLSNSVPLNQNTSILIETLCSILEISRIVSKIPTKSKK